MGSPDQPPRSRAARRRGPRAALAACRGAGRDRGASAIELAILGPALIVVSLLIIQFALWFDARHAALAAAQQGDLVAREVAGTSQVAGFNQAGGWQGRAKSAAVSYYQGLDTSLLASVTANVSLAGANSVSVQVTGKLIGIFPLRITETVTGPIECFRTEISQGAACG
jgi:Flp pilus assembly protein TadG